MVVLAATVVTHGSRCATVSAAGPELPAEAATNTPALYASRNASETTSAYGLLPPLIEKLSTSTPSEDRLLHGRNRVGREAALVAAHLVHATCARGAMPETRPRFTPKMLALHARVAGGRR